MRVPLALERRERRVEGPDESTAQLAQPLGRHRGPLVERGEERACGDLEVTGQPAEDLLGQEVVGVVCARIGVGLVTQPPCGPGEVERQRTHVLRGARPAENRRCLVAVERSTEALVGFLQERADLACERAAAQQALERARVRGLGRVVEQQDDPHAGVLLQRCREQGRPHDGRVLGVRGHQDRQRRTRVRHEGVDLRSRNADVPARPVERALPCEQVHEGGDQQEGHDADVDDRLDHEPAVVDPVVDEPRDHGLDQVHTPRHDGDRDRQAAQPGRPRPGRLLLHRERRTRTLGAPLPTASRRERPVQVACGAGRAVVGTAPRPRFELVEGERPRCRGAHVVHVSTGGVAKVHRSLPSLEWSTSHRHRAIRDLREKSGEFADRPPAETRRAPQQRLRRLVVPVERSAVVRPRARAPRRVP